PALVAAVGFGRYAMKGAFAEPIDFADRLFFAGVEVQQTPKSAILISLRRSLFKGVTTFPGSSRSPDFSGSSLVIEQRFTL
ncbi:MAG: hypothetical protein ACREM8_08335, partial [Vulcanimicrobiaceae bacterium]